MAFYPNGDLLPLSVRVALHAQEQRALAQGRAERAEKAPPAPAAPPVAPAAPRQYLRPSRPGKVASWASQTHLRILGLRIVAAALIGLLAAGVVILSVAVWQTDLSHVAAVASIALMTFAALLLDVWAIPALYEALAWRALARRLSPDVGRWLSAQKGA